MNIPYTQDLTDCFSAEIGDGGLERSAYDQYLAESIVSLKSIRARLVRNELPALGLPGKRDDLAGIEEVAAYFRQNFDDVIVLGTGGSSLGGQTLCALTERHFSPGGGATRLHFVDNVDPLTFDSLLGNANWARTGVVAISKSGTTAETLAQFSVLVAAMREHFDHGELARHVVTVTEPRENPLSLISAQLGCRILAHDPDIGGRYSALSVTGLLPASIAGLDIGKVRDGANTLLEALLGGKSDGDFAPAIGAAVSVGLQRTRGISISVLMAYSDRLADLGLWYRQLWAESLGKNGEGTLPVRAVGTVDQHSQLQLYLDGPADKMFSLILTDAANTGPSLPDDFAELDGLSYLKGRTIGDLMAAAGRATAETLANSGRPTRVFRIRDVDEATVGALMMHFMFETVIAADLIGVDPYDQPAVEEGKILTREYLAKGDSR